MAMASRIALNADAIASDLGAAIDGAGLRAESIVRHDIGEASHVSCRHIAGLFTFEYRADAGGKWLGQREFSPVDQTSIGRTRRD